MGGQTLAEKIATRHCARGPGRPLRAGDVAFLRPRHLLTHDNSAAILEQFLALGAPAVRYPWQALITLDHDVQNTDAGRLATWRRIQDFATAQRLDFRPCGSGVGHQIMVEEGFVVPASLCVAADSHANMYGALGALGLPVVRSDAAAIWATGEFWWEVPSTVRVRLEGRLSEGVTGKDLILSLCARFREGEVLGAIVEFDGPGVEHLTVNDRLTVANMTTEWGASGAVFPVDARTVEYLETVRRELVKRGRRRFTREQMERWVTAPLLADEDARYAAEITADLTSVVPTVAGPASPSERLDADVAIPIDKAFLAGCANARFEDLAAAARVLRGRRVHPRVKFYVAAASRTVQDEAVRSGVWQTLVEAGARTLPPGCAMCIGLGEGVLEPGEVAVSATNRNYPGRMGAMDSGGWLASPRVVAESAVRGEIRVPAGALRASIAVSGGSEAPAADPDLVPGFRERLEGRARFLRADDLDTDQIYPSTAVYERLDAAAMRAHLLKDHDPEFVGQLDGAAILVGGFRFGTGSSREQAATALLAAGITTVVAGSTTRTFRRNAANHGLLCIECPDLVRALQERSTGAPGVNLPDPLTIDFRDGVVRFAGESFPFARPSRIIQELYLGGGSTGSLRARFAQGGERR